jgi:hypothetical protein
MLLRTLGLENGHLAKLKVHCPLAAPDFMVAWHCVAPAVPSAQSDDFARCLMNKSIRGWAVEDRIDT